MILEFTAKVIEVLNLEKEVFVVLDKTAFYPTSGGQEHDTGYLIEKNSNKKFRVLDVIKYKNTILHKINTSYEEAKKLLGQEIIGLIDKKRRIILTQQHDAVHLLNGVCQEVLGKHIWQSGSHISEKKASLDVTHFKKIKDEEIEKIEEKLNDYIFERIPINKFVLERTEAERRFGFRIYQGGIIPSNHIRIIEIENIDIEACAGTHGNNTMEIQSAFLLGVNKIQDNVYRFELVAGLNAYLEYKKKKYLLDESAKIFNVKLEDLPKVSKRFFDEWKEQKKEIEKLSQYIMENLASLIEKSNDLIIEIPLENKFLINAARKFNKVFKNKEIVVGKKEFKKEIEKITKNFKESKDLIIGKIS